jgi:hypothetical protein
MFGFELTVSKARSRSRMSRMSHLFPCASVKPAGRKAFLTCPCPQALAGSPSPSERPAMLPRLALILSLAWTPAFAQEANLLPSLDGATGAASQLVLAQRVYRHAGKSGDPVLLLAAIRLARGVTIRAAHCLERTTVPRTRRLIARARPSGSGRPELPSRCCRDWCLTIPTCRTSSLIWTRNCRTVVCRTTVAKATLERRTDRHWQPGAVRCCGGRDR